MRGQVVVGGSLIVLTAFAFFCAGHVSSAAADTQCTLTVAPKIADTGSEFHLRGRGFTPTTLTLQKNGGTPATIVLNLGSQDPFDIPIKSQPGDEGKWVATVSVDGGCSASVAFTATLENTDMASDPFGPRSASRLPLAIVLIVVVAGLTGGAFAAQRLSASTRGRQ
jgi:hypothetical protein